MNVTIINKSDRTGGAAVAAMRLTKALRKQGANVRFLAQEKKGTEPFVETTAANRFHKYRNYLLFLLEIAKNTVITSSKRFRFQYSPAIFGSDLSKHAAVKNADILHIHWYNQGFLSLKNIEQLIKLGKPVVFTLHDMWLFTGGCHFTSSCVGYKTDCSFCPMLKMQDNSYSEKLLDIKIKLLNNNNIEVITCSNWLNNEASQSSVLKKLPIHTVPNPIDTETFKPADTSSFRKELGIAPEKRILLFGAANIGDKRKGFKHLLEALEILAQNVEIRESTVLVIFGKMKDEMPKIPLETIKLEYINSIEQMAKLYALADVFILPSLEDNLPNTIMEAMACGTPCVAFRTGGLPDMIDHDKNGMLADFASAQNLSEQTKKLLFHPNYDAFRNAAREKVLRDYNQERIANKHLEIYKQMLDGTK